MNINEQILQKLSDPCFDNLFPVEMIEALKDKNGEGYSEAIALLSAQLTLLLKEEVHQDNDYVKTQPPLTHKPTLAETAISLKEKHISYKQQLLLGIGEAEEYKKLCVEYPDLQVKLQAKYNTVRDQNTKILGKIKVIESLLNNKST
jgi:hypothetical protein